jgi:hypothetical protein
MANWAKLQEDLVGLPVAKRAKHGIHFKKGANEFVANFSGKPCHYEDGGIWKPIDTKLVLLPDGFYGCPHSKVKVHPDGRVAVAGTDYAQRVELPSAKTGLADGDKLIREFSFGKQEMRITENGYRSEITLNRIPTLKEARKLIASESGTLSKEYLKRLTTATDANGDTHTFTTLTAFRTWLASAKFPVVIDPDFAGGTGNDQTIYSDDANYATAHATGDKAIAADLYTGQMLSGGVYYVYRSVLSFDTSSIDDGQAISQVNLKMTVHYEQSATDFDVQIVKYDWAGITNIDTLFDGVLAATADDNIFCNTAGKSAGSQYTSGNLSTTWVSKTGTTYYGLRSSLDVAETAPSGNDRFVLYDEEAVTESYRPVLTVTYTAAGTFIPINLSANMQSLTGGMRG